MDSQNYQSLTDPNLNAYFNNKRIRRHLIKAGLINRDGDILPQESYEKTTAQRAKRRQAKARLSYAITNYVIEQERKRQVFFRNQFDLAIKRSRIEKIRESKSKTQRSISHGLIHHTEPPTNRNARTSSPPPQKRSPVRVKSARHPPIAVKNQVIRRPNTAKQQFNEDCCEVTMIYYGPQINIEHKSTWYQPNGDEIVVMQQHCGGENLIVFKGFVKPDEIFTFDSLRHPDYPFALALYINGLIDSRISVCCEYKHKHNVRLGSKYGLFGIYDVQKSQPCRSCRFEQRKKKFLSIDSINVNPSPPRRPILTTEFRPEALLRTPMTSPEREKTSAKQDINRISTVVQASLSPRVSSSASSQIDKSKKDDKSSTFDQKKDDSKKSSRVSSSTSKKSGPSFSDILFNNEKPHHSSEPLLTKMNRNDHDDESSNTSRQSGPLPIDLAEDEDDHHSLKLLPENKNTNNDSRRSSSSTSSKKSSSSSSIALVNNNNNHVRSSSSSSTTLKRSSSSSSNIFSEKEDALPPSKLFTEEIDMKKQSSSSSRTSKTSDLSLKNKTNEKLIKEKNSSTSSSTSERVDRLFLSDQEPDSPETTENSHHSIKNEHESHRSSISSTENQQLNDIITQNPIQSDTTASDDDFKSNSISRKKRQNDEDERLSTKPEKTPERLYCPVENLILVWLDSTLDNPDQDTLNSKIQLRQIVRTLRTFSDSNKCLQLFKEIKNEKIFLIVSGSLSEIILEQIDDYSQLVIIYIFCEQKLKYEKLPDQYPKIKGIYTDISTICERLKIDSKQWDNDLSTFQISSAITNEFELHSEQLLLFIQNQLFKKYLLEIEYNDNSIPDLIEYWRKLYIENDKEIELINQFEQTYKSNNAIDWYTKDCFAYHMLNRAIRTKDIKILSQMGFFIRDINQQLEEDYSATAYRSTLTVFRGQGMKLEYFEELKQNQDGFLSFNGFVSTSKKRNIAYEFAQRSLTNGFPIAVLFQIKIDPKTTSIPFSSLENLSSNPSEYEILLSFKAIFQIQSIEQIENNLWQIDLTLTDKISPYIQIEHEKFNHLMNYEKFGELLIEMNELNKAKDLYEINLPNMSDPKYTYVCNQLALICTKLEVYNESILYYKLLLRTKSNETLNDYVTISNIHNEIGKIFYKQKKFREALEKFREALNIQLEHLSSTDLSLINTYDLLAMISEENKDYQTALEYHQKQLDIQEESSLSKQSDLALTHFKIGICLENLNQLDEAMDHIQQSIDISPSHDSESNDRQAVLERIREQIE